MNRISDIPKDFFIAQKSLVFLDISRNRIRSISGDALRGLFSLTNLDLSHNFISYLPVELFQYTPRISSITLNHNMIGVSELEMGVFGSLANVQEIDLNGNKIKSLNKKSLLPIHLPAALSAVL